MNILILGDGHVYGHGLPSGRLSYVAQFIRLITQTGRSVSVEAYTHLSLPQTLSVLTYLPLNRYDLIIVQPGHDWFRAGGPRYTPPARSPMTYKPGGSFVPMLPEVVRPPKLLACPMPESRFRRALRRLLMSGFAVFNWRKLPNRFNRLLVKLRPFRHNVLLLTPFPHNDPVNRRLGRRSRAMLLREGNRQLFSVFDSSAVVQPREEYFLPDSDEYLNDISHELLGRALFDFYLSAPTIVTVQAIKPD